MNTPSILTGRAARGRRPDLRVIGPLVALVVLVLIGVALNPNFLSYANITNVLARLAFIGIIAIGMTFVITAGGLDLSVGSMAALVAGLMILVMNQLGAGMGNGLPVLLIGIALALLAGLAAGLVNGILITRAGIEAFILTLGTMGIYRSLVTWLADGGMLSLNAELREPYRPVYYDGIAGVGWPIIVFALLAVLGEIVMRHTAFGRHCAAIGSNEKVARYSSVAVTRVKLATYVILGLLVGIAVVMRGIASTVDNERVEGFQAALEGSGIEVLAMDHANWNRDNAFSLMQDYLSRFASIDAVWAADDDQAVGALAAIEQAGREGEMTVVGGAGMKEMVERIRNGDKAVPVDVTNPPSMISTAIQMTALGLTGMAPMAGELILASELITPENAGKFLFEDSPY